MSDFSISLIRRGKKNEKLGGYITAILIISSILIFIVLLQLIPVKFELEYTGFEFLGKWKWSISAIILIFAIGLIFYYLNKRNYYGKLLFKEDEIVEIWKNETQSIKIDNIEYLKYLFTNSPDEPSKLMEEKHWITIKKNGLRKEFHEECLIDNDQIDFMKILHSYKKRGVKIEIATIY